jgi:quinol monooxygenase YgiN
MDETKFLGRYNQAPVVNRRKIYRRNRFIRTFSLSAIAFRKRHSSLSKKGGYMVVRLTYVSFLPDKAEQARRVYRDEIIPVVRKQKGNLECRFFEPVEKTGDYISLTSWDTKEQADAYHSSGVYSELVNKLKGFYSKDPVLKVYTSENILEPA